MRRFFFSKIKTKYDEKKKRAESEKPMRKNNDVLFDFNLFLCTTRERRCMQKFLEHQSFLHHFTEDEGKTREGKHERMLKI